MKREELERLRPSHTEDPALRRRRWMSIAALAVFLIFSVAAIWFIGRPMIRFVDEPEGFRAWVDGHGAGGRLVFVGMVAVQVVVALIPGEPLEIGAGYAFGAIEGTLLCLAGIALGSAVVYGFVRRFGMKVVEPFYSKEEILALPFFQDKDKLESLIFLLFFIPGTPKDVMTWAVGLTPVKFSHWMLITMLARLPSIITSTVGGDALGGQNYVLAIIVFIVTAAVSLGGLAVYRRMQKRIARRKAQRHE